MLNIFTRLAVFVVFAGMVLFAAEPSAWSEAGELAYSFSYARDVLGYRMRTRGWRCTMSFTTGAKRDTEHSIWVKGDRKKQMMIWRIESGRTGYCIGEISVEESVAGDGLSGSK